MAAFLQDFESSSDIVSWVTGGGEYEAAEVGDIYETTWGLESASIASI